MALEQHPCLYRELYDQVGAVVAVDELCIFLSWQWYLLADGNPADSHGHDTQSGCIEQSGCVCWNWPDLRHLGAFCNGSCRTMPIGQADDNERTSQFIYDDSLVELGWFSSLDTRDTTTQTNKSTKRASRRAPLIHRRAHLASW
jgi:hypothetical protein